MATVVRHNTSGNHFVLVGVGFGMYRTARPNAFFGEILPTEDGGEAGMVALCLPNGEIKWANHSEVTVVSIDGRSPQELVDPFD
ncbi:MAG: hypothetical protein AAF226_10795 [Verrucomicrobiota bacterium]